MKLRIVIASPPKTGNVWVKNLLAEIYDLNIFAGPKPSPEELKKFFTTEIFQDNSIFHEHYRASEELFALGDLVDAKWVTTLRNPYDTFVSLFYYVQNFPRLFPEGHRLSVFHGESINGPAALDYLASDSEGFGALLDLGEDWIAGGKSIIIRYEDLHANPMKELKKVTAQIQDVPKKKIKTAIKNCSAENMRQRDEDLEKHIRKASVGDWRNHLGEKHLEIIRARHAERINQLGYSVH